MRTLAVESIAVRSAVPNVFSFDRVHAALVIGRRYLEAGSLDLANHRQMVCEVTASFGRVVVAEALLVPCGAGNGLAVRQQLRDIFGDLLMALATTRSSVAAARQEAARRPGTDADLRVRMHLRFIDATLATGYAHLAAVDALANGWHDLRNGPFDTSDPFCDAADWPTRDH